MKIGSLKLFALLLISTVTFAQTDTLIIRGRVENLSIELYRQAPNIVLTRVNILQPNREVVRVAQLEANGSFELKMPLIYPQEECHLNYANLSVPFFCKNGTMEVTIYGDSLTKSDVPLRFRGLNATTNNRHAKFEVAFKKWLKANPEKSINTTSTLSFWEKLLTEQNRRIDYYRKFATFKDPLLDTWVESSFQEETKARFYAYLTQAQTPMPLDLLTRADLDTNILLTYSKADCYQQFTNHALVTTATPSQNTLAIEKLAHLILQYVPNLAKEDSLRLRGFVEGKSAKMTDLKWLNGLFKQKEEILTLVSLFELYMKQYGAVYNQKELDYLKGMFYTNNLYSFTSDKMSLWYKHIRPTLQNSYYARTLDEIHHIESQDTLKIAQAKRNFYTLDDNRTSNQYSIDITPEVSVYKDFNKNGPQLWKEIREKNKDKAIYAIFWTNDEFGRRALAESTQFRATLLEERVAFVYLSEYSTDEDVWIENIIRSDARGLHVKLDREQSDFFAEDWRINRVPHCVFVDANGKYIDRNAPLPADREGWNKLWNKMR